MITVAKESSSAEITSYQRNDTDFLRAVAICLIINSHMDYFYPIQLLATGGMIGNSLFFMLASLGLYLSWQKKSKSAFNTWYGHRISRIYPSVWMVVILITIPNDIYLGFFTADTFLSEIGKFFFPPFWFLQALLIYYFFIFFILKSYSHKLLIITVIPVLLLYTTYYVFHLDLTRFSIESDFFRVIFYFLIILWGLYLGSIKEKISYRGERDILFLLLSVGFIYAHKYSMYHKMLSEFQFVQHLAVFPLLYYSLKVAKSTFITNVIMNHPFFGKPIKYVSTITLELFIVGNSVEMIVSQLNYAFPFNSIVFVGLTLVLATVVYICSQNIRKIFEYEAN